MNESSRPLTAEELEYEQECLKMQARRDELMAWIRKYKSYSDNEVAKYIDDAEDADGYEYWLQFESPEQLASDMRLYFTAVSR